MNGAVVRVITLRRTGTAEWKGWFEGERVQQKSVLLEDRQGTVKDDVILVERPVGCETGPKLSNPLAKKGLFWEDVHRTRFPGVSTP